MGRVLLETAGNKDLIYRALVNYWGEQRTIQE